ncbi:MAG: basic amino acid ABC transporter substrate-binding protein [Chroococcidiopsidaceae cyanobacterium CP_BM_ER_R8_30]|nr:basic amino acid ABC transporter substrate-binding protein [Chroococcidiopsidaceae cyanobacterium CP_BM_ER_R8_30]
MVRSTLRWWRQLVLALSCLLLVIACNNSSPTSTKSASSSSGGSSNPTVTTLKVATDPTFAPFEFQVGNQKQTQGFDIDLINGIGKAAGLQIQLQSMRFDGIIPALQSGNVDAAISGMTITKKRLDVVSFSRPYIKAGLAIAVQDSNNSVTSLADLKDKKIAVQIGTTGAAEAKKVPGAQIITFDTSDLPMRELGNGNVDAVVTDAPATLHAIKTGSLKGIKIVGKLLTQEYYGIAVPKNSANLEAINKGLDTLIQNGTYDKIYQRWFNTKPSPLPTSASAVAA